MAQPQVPIDALAALIGADPALASALLKSVNAALFGLRGSVQTVQRAITYLGVDEVAAMTLQVALQAAFPAAPELQALWERSAERARRMGRLGQALGAGAWACHSAGLFEECGKAVLFRHAPDRYRGLLAQATDDQALAQLEHEAFGATHEVVGAALCETWGLAPAAVHCVRHRVQVHAGLQLPAQPEHRAVAAVSVLAQAVATAPAGLDALCQRLAPELGWDPLVMANACRAADDPRRAGDAG
jgi:HD-like signal output (HDOD) protein